MCKSPFFVRTSAQSSNNRFFFRKFNPRHTKTSTSLYGQLDAVRSRKISEIETMIDALEHQKSTIVREGGIEPPPGAWKAPVLPLNHSRVF